MQAGIYTELNNVIVKGDFNVSEACFIEGASCVLKSSLDNTLINDQVTSMESSIEREEDIFTMLGNIFSPQDNNITNTNIQTISNSVTQMINSTCQNKAETINSSVILLNDVVIEGDFNSNRKNGVSHTTCIINNMVKNYVENSQEADMSASIKIKGSLGSILMIAFIVLIIYLSIRYGGSAGGKGGGGNDTNVVVENEPKSSPV